MQDHKEYLIYSSWIQFCPTTYGYSAGHQIIRVKMPEKLDYVTTLSPEIIERAEKELGEDEHRRTESVLALREWAKKQPHLHAMPLGMNYLYYLFIFNTYCFLMNYFKTEYNSILVL